jgi:hypothetical protein
MAEIIGWIEATADSPANVGKSEAAEGTVQPAYCLGLARVPGWTRNARATADKARWHDRLAELVRFRGEGNDWPRHHHYTSDREHTLGVWIHAQRQKHRNGALDAEKAKLLDEAVPGWQTGGTRGRQARGIDTTLCLALSHP